MRRFECRVCGAAGPARVLRAGRDRIFWCGSCGSGTRDRVLSGESYYARSYHADLRPCEAALSETRRRLARALFPRVRRCGRGRVLDVGCGYGEFLDEARAAGWECAGVEPSTGCSAAARARHPNVFVGTFEEFGEVTGAGSYRHVCLWNVLDQLPDPLGALRLAVRLLEDGGRCHLRVPNGRFHLVGAVLASACGADRLFRKRPYVFQNFNFSPGGLRALAARAGGRMVELRNAPMTEGDPYGYGCLGPAAVGALKKAVHGWAEGVRAISGGRLLPSSSLLAVIAPDGRR